MTTSFASPPCISVIVPVYDVADYVAACIASLRSQTLKDFEVIVVDDGSTDSSAEIAAHAMSGDPRFQLIRQDNRGLSGARNTGLRQARGDFIAFVDSDDRVAPDFLQTLLDALQTTGGDWVACAIRSCYADGTSHVHCGIHATIETSLQTGPRRYQFQDWCDVIAHFPSVWNKLYRRTLIEDIWFDEGTWFEDHSFFERVSLRTDHILHVPEPLYLQTRDRPGQITNQDDDRVFEQFDVLCRVRDIMQDSTRPGSQDAFSRLASRLLYERSVALRQPERRQLFAAAGHRFLEEQKIGYVTDWDPEIAQSWAMEMNGTLPLSIILPWDGTDLTALRGTLDSLSRQHGPGREVLIPCRSHCLAQATEIAAEFPGSRAIQHKGRTQGHALEHGLRVAQGHFVIFLRPGAVLRPVALHDWCEAMLRHEADLGISQFEIRPSTEGGAPVLHNGFTDMRGLPQGTPRSGPLTLDEGAVLSLAPELSAKIFRRAFLIEQKLYFTKTARPGWALELGAAIAARKSVYTDWPAVSLPEDPGNTGGLVRGHDALVRALSANSPAPLPDGWKRRLFDRALRAEIPHARNRSRIKLAVLLGTAMQAAIWRGLSGSTPFPAGFDSAFGPRSALLLDPVSLLRRALGRPRAATLESRQLIMDNEKKKNANRSESFSMLLFPLKETGLFRFGLDFADVPYANLSFFAADKAEIPFHLSLRFDEGLAVCNDRTSDHQWGKERRKPASFPKKGAEVLVQLTRSEVRVMLEGQLLFHFGRKSLLNRTGFSNLDTIKHLDLQGGVRPSDIIPQDPKDGLIVDPRLQIRASGKAEDLRLTNLADGSNIPLIATTNGDGSPAVQALLTGRVWQSVPQDGALEIQLTDLQGNSVGRGLKLSRSDLFHRLNEILTLEPSNADTTLALLVLEHLRHADLLSELSPEKLQTVKRLIDFYDLETFMRPPSGDECTEAEDLAQDGLRNDLLHPPDPGAMLVDNAVARFTSALNRKPAPKPLDIVAELTLPLAERQALFLILGEFFARKGQDFDGLFALAQEAGLAKYERNGTAWNDSAVLPFLFCQGELEDVCDQMWALAEPSDDWITTSPIAWVLRRTLETEDLPAEMRDTIIYAFMEIVDRRAKDYWDRSHCQELTYAAVMLLVQRHQTPYYLQKDIINFCLRVYGLSRQFWSILDSETDVGEPFPTEIQAARQSFAQLAAADAPLVSKEQALSLFDRFSTYDAWRMRREILGPAGVNLAPGVPLDAATLMASGWTPELAALRHMATPNSAPVTPQVSDLAAQAIEELYSDLPRAPYLAQQGKAARQISRVFADPDAQVSGAQLDQILAQCHLLGDEKSQFLGVAMACALICECEKMPQYAMVREQIFGWIEQHNRNLTKQAQEDLRQAPAVRMALFTLRSRLSDPHVHARLASLLAIAPDDQPEILETQTADAQTSALYDTIVTVFSCKPYLDTRIPALRAGWLSLLETMKVPYVIVVGDGNGQRCGDVLHLDAPDDYEGLPLKTMAAIRWVHDHTSFTHMLKIDDDCFLNAPLFFESLNYRKFDYYGRRLTRGIGQMDRVWHQQKSVSARGQMELDKSPEPSVYADGGSGYTLSRSAMSAALSAAESPAGQHLLQTSFMEDKMLGDLLALRGIWVSDEDYRTTVRRRTHSKAIPVASWQNSFSASKTAPIHMVHMDTHLGHDTALARLNDTGLWPAKIWPSYQEAQLGYQSNALELVSSAASVQKARDADVALVACMRNEMFMLPHFLAHYRKLGVGAFLIADNCSDDGTLEYLAAQPDVALFSVDTDYRLSRYGVAWQQALLSAFRVGKWSVVADADELLVWQEKPTQTLSDLLASPDFEDADAARIFMLDMYPKGPLEQATFKTDPFAEAGFSDETPFLTQMPSFGPYSDRPTWTSALRHRLIPGSRPNLFVAQKLALLKYQPWMRLSAGLHYVGDTRLASRELIFAHFKYNADFRRKAQTEVARQQHFNDAEEYRKYLALASEGRSVIYDPNISVPWSKTAFARRILDS